VDAGLFSNLGYNRSVNFVNTDLSRNDVYTTGGGLTLAKYVPGQYSIRLNAGLNYFHSRSSINVGAPLHYWGQTHSAMLGVFPFHGFEVNTNANYIWQEKTGAFGKNISVMAWNAFLNQNFCKNQLALRFSVNNILDANAGISRGNSGNVNTESSTNVMGRYWILSVIYHFAGKYSGK